MSKITDIAQRIAVNAAAALDDVRAGEDFPSHLYEQVVRDVHAIRDAQQERSISQPIARLEVAQ